MTNDESGYSGDLPFVLDRMERGQTVNDVEKLSFEDAFGELETTVQHLEAGDLTLEEAIALYERGMSLARHCNDSLDAAELRVQQLAEASNLQQAAWA